MGASPTGTVGCYLGWPGASQPTRARPLPAEPDLAALPTQGLTAYHDISLDKCYVIELNTTIVLPPRNFWELLMNVKVSGSPRGILPHSPVDARPGAREVPAVGACCQLGPAPQISPCPSIFLLPHPESMPLLSFSLPLSASLPLS